MHCPKVVKNIIRSRWNFTSDEGLTLVAPDCSLTEEQAECMPVPLRPVPKAMEGKVNTVVCMFWSAVSVVARLWSEV